MDKVKALRYYETAQSIHSIHHHTTYWLSSYSRTYAPAIAGVPLTASFDPITAVFTLTYQVSLAATEPTIIFLNEQLYETDTLFR